MNLMELHTSEGGVHFGDHLVPISRDQMAGVKDGIIVGVRPEDVSVSEQGDGLPVEVDLVEELGADGYLYGHADVEGKRVDIVARVDGRNHAKLGDTVYITPDETHLHVFDKESGLRI